MKFIPCYPDFFQKKAGGGGISAIALYDYQAMAEDEISFDPNDVITNIEMVGCFSPMQCQVLSSFILVSISIFNIVHFVPCHGVHVPKVDEGWWIGECHGKFGLFPANYVEVLQEQ